MDQMNEGMGMDYDVQLFKSWAEKSGLTPLHVFGDFDGSGEELRIWWFFNGSVLISPREGLCNDEVVAFFSGTHFLTYVDQLLLGQSSKHDTAIRKILDVTIKTNTYTGLPEKAGPRLSGK